MTTATQTETKSQAAELTTKQLAEALKTDAKTLRRYLRSQGVGVGQGGRYTFQKSDVAKHRKPFQTWLADQEAKRAAREAEIAKAKATEADANKTD